MIKKLMINCKGIENISVSSNTLDVTLEDIEPDFIEELKSEDIILYHDNDKLLDQMDSDVIMSYLEKHYSVDIRELR